MQQVALADRLDDERVVAGRRGRAAARRRRATPSGRLGAGSATCGEITESSLRSCAASVSSARAGLPNVRPPGFAPLSRARPRRCRCPRDRRRPTRSESPSSSGPSLSDSGSVEVVDVLSVVELVEVDVEVVDRVVLEVD